jgi:hypothetical protein
VRLSDAWLRRTVTVAVAIATSGILSACSEDSAPATPVSPSADLPETLEGIAGDTLFEIGASQGESWQTFGGIWDVDVSPSGNIAILDIDTGQAHVYGPDGAHIGSVVERGLEPGSLEGPSGLAWRDADELLVWDPAASWVSRFTVGNGGVEFQQQSRAYAFGETGFCAAGDRTYLSFFQDSLVVHEVGEEGIARSFGSAPEIPGMSTLGPELQEIAVEELSPSGLLCTPQGVLDVSMFGSRIRFHDPDGTLVWERELEDFSPMVVSTPDGVGLARQFDAAQGTPLLHSVVRWGDDFALVQHEIRTREFPAEGEIPMIESRLIRLSDGTEVDRTRELPRILATWGRRIYMVVNEPYSKIVVVEVG